MSAALHIVFTAAPGPGRECVFVEVETPDGKSINAGEWIDRADGLVELVIAFPVKPECPYCGATDGLRMKCDGGGYVAPEYTCEGCFTGTDDGPNFDDLPEA
jgi:hypothetical protein